eukprot:2221428-Pyramimonas_sp.AAC.1
MHHSSQRIVVGAHEAPVGRGLPRSPSSCQIDVECAFTAVSDVQQRALDFPDAAGPLRRWQNMSAETSPHDRRRGPWENSRSAA